MRVLMVDDDAGYLSACATILTDDGHDVVACADFAEGRRYLAEDHFDALITDVRLGAFNGLHLIALAPLSMIKIALSAFADPVIRRDAEQAGAQLVVKPANCAWVSALLGPAERTTTS
jgi:DNA-binding response OmpR family regulator